MRTLRRGSRAEGVDLLQELLGVTVDGRFGPATERAVASFQFDHGLVIDRTVGEKTWAKLFELRPLRTKSITSRFLSEGDLGHFAVEHKLEHAVVMAVNKVESAGRGFIGGKVKILFEGHVFWRRLRHQGMVEREVRQLARDHPNVLYRRWTREHYWGGAAEHTRLGVAKTIHETAALESASWGCFQVMGFNYAAAGFGSVGVFARTMDVDEAEQLKAFGRFLEHEGLVEVLRAKDWRTFARTWNGSGQVARYAGLLERAYRRYAA